MDGNPLVFVAIISYMSYPVLYLASLIASALASSGPRDSKWPTRLAFLPALGPAIFVLTYVVLAITQ